MGVLLDLWGVRLGLGVWALWAGQNSFLNPMRVQRSVFWQRILVGGLAREIFSAIFNVVRFLFAFLV